MIASLRNDKYFSCYFLTMTIILIVIIIKVMILIIIKELMIIRIIT